MNEVDEIEQAQIKPMTKNLEHRAYCHVTCEDTESSGESCLPHLSHVLSQHNIIMTLTLSPVPGTQGYTG